MRTTRTRIGKGIFRDKFGISAVVKVGTTGTSARQREKRFSFDTPFREIKAWQLDTRADLGQLAGRCSTTTRGTLAGDAAAYLAQMKTLASYKSRVCEVNAWTALYGRLRRAQLTSEHVRKARATWIEGMVAPKTINNRCQTLRHWYRVLDGARAPTPVDGVKPLPVPVSPKILVPATIPQRGSEPRRPEDAGALSSDRLDGRAAG